MTRVLSIALFGCILLNAQDAREIVRRAAEMDQANYDRAKAYSYQHRVEERKLADDGTVCERESKTYRTILLSGDPYHQLILRNDQPLTAAELQREQEKMAKESSERQKTQAVAKGRERRRRMLRELPDAFTFTLAKDEVINGRPVYVILAEPKPGYQPIDAMASRVFPKIRGKLWIDKAEGQWVRAAATVIEPITFGLFLARLAPGAQVYGEQLRVDEQVWVPHKVDLKFDARVALVKHVNQEMLVTFKDYKKPEIETGIITKRTKAAQN